MSLCNFCVSPGLSVTSPTNVEDIVSSLNGPPHVLPDKQASFSAPTARVVISQKTVRNGTNVDEMIWDVLSQTSFNALITHIFGGFDVDSADVTYITIDESGQYSTFTGSAVKPYPGADYHHQGNGLDLRDVSFKFRRYGTTGAFSGGFSIGFEV